MSLHWGYIIISPDISKNSAVIRWGDSLGFIPPEDLMETVRAYLVLLFRSVCFTISRQNHALEVLGFRRQEDSYSCGFYVIAVMATFANGFQDEEFSALDYGVYDASVTEKYRIACVRNLVRHILREDNHPGVFQIFASVKEECRANRETANSDRFAMYREIPEIKRSLFGREDKCIVQEAIEDLDGEKLSHLQSGLLSDYAASPRPFIKTVCLSERRKVLSFSELVEVSTVCVVSDVNENSNHREALNFKTGDEHPIIRSDLVEQGVSGNTLVPGAKSSSTPDTDLTRSKEGFTITEDFSNIFAYLSVRLLEGHLLRKPEYLMYKNSNFVLRLRMRCRLYDPPPKWDRPLSEYQRCPVRLYARLVKSGGWHMTFRHNHNHRIWSSALLSGTEVRNRLLSMRSSLAAVYEDASTEHRKWMNGFRDIGQRCPAVSGTWTESWKEECERDYLKLENKEDAEQRLGKDSRSYTNILPRVGPVGKDLELITPLDTPGLSLGSLRVGDREMEEVIPLRLQVEETLSKYIQGCVVTMDGKDLKQEVQHMSECFGFPMTVRNSYYFQDESVSSQFRGPAQVQKLVFRCTVGIRTRLRKPCHHQFTVLNGARTYVKTGDDEHEDDCLNRTFVIKFSKIWHNHKADTECLGRCLPSEVWKEAVHLRDKSLISTADIVRHLEDKFGFNLDRKVLARRLRWETHKRHPVERDCQQLISNLFKLSRIHPGTFVEARVVDDNSLHSVCWGFPQWLRDYKQFGIIPGVSIDAKAIANNYDTPLAFIGGRTNNGKITIFFMGFLATQREEEFVWFLEQFREFVGVPPRVITTDQDAAIISSIRTVLPTAVVMLDDWHLNQNQMKNTKSCAGKRGEQSLANEMNTDLYELRRSSGIVEFFQRRRRFEEKFFTDGDIPRWYRSLYYTYYKLVVLGFNRTTSGERFLFQGTGYVESANSQYKRVIIGKKVPMSRIPEEMLRYTKGKVRERSNDLGTTKFLDRKYSLSVGQLGLSAEMWEDVVHRCTSFAIERFIEFSLTNAHHYTVPNCEVVQSVYGEAFSLSVTTGTEEQRNLRTYKVTSPRKWSSDEYVPCMCSCQWSQSTGLPCRHAARAATVFREFAVTSGRFPLECMFHPYWRKDREGWKDEDILASRLGRLNDIVTPHGEEDNPGCEEDREQERLDRMRTLMWCNGHSTWNQLHQRVSKKGITAMRKLDRVMSLLLEEVTRNGERDNLNTALVTRRVMEAVEAECGPSSRPRKLDIEKAETEIFVKNSSQGAVKGRGTKKRPRSWTETDAKKKNKKKESSREPRQNAKVRFLQPAMTQ